MSRLLWESADF
jgi:hypothetical protein